MTIKKQEAILVLDIGKTNVKLHLLGTDYHSLTGTQMPNKPIDKGLYPHADVEGIWSWILSAINNFSSEYAINVISITTHGATAALINRAQTNSSDALVLPVLDYEFTGVESSNKEYAQSRPAFSETLSPNLPMGLNLGRQLFWLEQQFPEQFSQVTDILMYPQYWAWRLTGQCFSEVTSLGCHTDLWNPTAKTFSSLVDTQQWAHLFPPIKSAWELSGTVTNTKALDAGLTQDCRVYMGVHDSNASFLRYKLNQVNKPFTVISTGTWTILMSSGSALQHLVPQRDMLANVDVEAKPIACARFMGGREYEVICVRLSGVTNAIPSAQVLQSLINEKVMALPDFSEGSGPFGGAPASFVNSNNEQAKRPDFGAAVATLYCLMMIDYQLDMLQARGDIFIEGAFLRNTMLCGLLAQLRTQQSVWLSADTTGTVQGCARLTRWQSRDSQLSIVSAEKFHFTQLQEYRHYWRTLVERREHF